jgi:hypothetical protein
MNPKVKEIMIKNGFLTIDKLIDILDKNGINIKIE